MSGNRIAVTAACWLIGLSPLTVSLADEHIDEDAERCISIRQIDRTEVIDDHSILFYMRGGPVYRNQLPHRCPGLRREKTFMYRTSSSWLCDLDIATVLHDRGFGFTPGASCGLGRFQPITEEDVEALKKPPPAIEPQEVPSADPEEIVPDHAPDH